MQQIVEEAAELTGRMAQRERDASAGAAMSGGG
jgi:hypothetical protein